MLLLAMTAEGEQQETRDKAGSVEDGDAWKLKHAGRGEVEVGYALKMKRRQPRSAGRNYLA